MISQAIVACLKFCLNPVQNILTGLRVSVPLRTLNMTWSVAAHAAPMVTTGSETITNSRFAPIMIPIFVMVLPKVLSLDKNELIQSRMGYFSSRIKRINSAIVSIFSDRAPIPIAQLSLYRPYRVTRRLSDMSKPTGISPSTP